MMVLGVIGIIYLIISENWAMLCALFVGAIVLVIFQNKRATDGMVAMASLKDFGNAVVEQELTTHEVMQLYPAVSVGETVYCCQQVEHLYKHPSGRNWEKADYYTLNYVTTANPDFKHEGIRFQAYLKSRKIYTWTYYED